MIIDGHLHLFRPAHVIDRAVDELAPADRDAPVEELLEVQARHGVDGAVVVALGTEDDYLADVLARFPDRFAGVAGAPVPDPGTSGPLGTELHDRHSRVRFHGVRVRWLGDPARRLADSPMYDLLRWAADRDVVVWVYVAADQLGLLEEVVEALPSLRLVLNHLGFCPGPMRVDAHRRPRFDEGLPPATLPRIRRLARHRQVYLMLSGQYAFSDQPPPYRDLDVVVRPLVQDFGADRTLWASDWPWIKDEPGYRALLDLPAQALPDASPAELADILGGTAARLFPHLRSTDTGVTDAPTR